MISRGFLIALILIVTMVTLLTYLNGVGLIHFKDITASLSSNKMEETRLSLLKDNATTQTELIRKMITLTENQYPKLKANITIKTKQIKVYVNSH